VAQDRLTSIHNETGIRISAEEACIALCKGFEMAMNLEIMKNELTEYERALAENLKEKKYSTDSWNMKR
jgi:lipoate-protein ligase A